MRRWWLGGNSTLAALLVERIATDVPSHRELVDQVLSQAGAHHHNSPAPGGSCTCTTLQARGRPWQGDAELHDERGQLACGRAIVGCRNRVAVAAEAGVGSTTQRSPAPKFRRGHCVMPSFRSSFSSNSRREMHLGFTIGLHNVDRTACLLAAGGNLDKCNAHTPLSPPAALSFQLCVCPADSILGGLPNMLSTTLHSIRRCAACSRRVEQPGPTGQAWLGRCHAHAMQVRMRGRAQGGATLVMRQRRLQRLCHRCRPR